MCLCIEFRFKFSNIYMSTPKILDFIKSIEKQKEWYEFITKGRKDIGFNAMIESDINMVIDQTDKSWGDAGYSSHLDDDFFNEIENKEESSKEAIEDSFKIQYGRELVKLYTLIWDTQNPIQNFILKFKSDLLNEDNIMLFIDYGLKNGYIAETHKFASENAKSKQKNLKE